MGNLFGIGLSGLAAAQSGLTTTGNNISNVNTPGYTRREVLLGQAPVSQNQGTGVLVSGIERQYQRFLSLQVRNAESTSSSLKAHSTQMSRINNLLGDSDAGLAPLMQDFFASITTVAGHPSDPAAREALLGDARNMAAQFRTFSSYLSDMGNGVEEQLRGAVKQINNYGKQIAELNDQISLTRAQTGRPPNKLLDERNRLVSELGQLVDPEVTIQDGDKYIVTVAGRPLVDATGAHSFKLTPSEADAGKRVIAYVGVDGQTHELDAKDFEGGQVGGLLEFRSESLQETQLRLNQLAHAMGASVNRVHASGYDLEGETGNVFFAAASEGQYTPNNVATYVHPNNTSSVGISGFTVPNAPADTSDKSSFRIEYTGVDSNNDPKYKVIRLSDGHVYSVKDTNNDHKIKWGGGNDFSVQLGGQPAQGDSFLLKTSGSFSPATPEVIPNKGNTGTAVTLDVNFNGNLADVQPSNYRIEFDSGSNKYEITRLSDGKVFHQNTGQFSLDGLTFNVSGGPPDDGDSFLVKPLEGSASGLRVAIDDAADIAAANPDPTQPEISNGSGDAGNMLELANLQNQSKVGGQASFNDAYAQLVSDVGNKTSVLQVNSAAQDSLTTELRKSEQSVSGVNLAEERVNLLQYTKLYRANAKVIQTATTVMDTVLRIG